MLSIIVVQYFIKWWLLQLNEAETVTLHTSVTIFIEMHSKSDYVWFLLMNS